MTLKFDENKIPYIDLENGYAIRLETDELTEEEAEKAKRELRETPEVVESALKELRVLLQEEKTLDIPLEDDPFLIKFLRPCKFYPQSAFELIKRYYKFKLKHKNICDDLFPSSVRHVFEQQLIHFQPLRDQHGRRIMILEVGKKWKPSKCSLNDLFRTVQLSLEIAMIEPRTMVNGVVVMLDMEGLSLSQICQFTPSFACMALEWVQECTSIRLKAVHIVNNSYLFNMLFAIFKPFISEKLRKRIFFQNKDWKALTSHIRPEALRSRYGGTLDVPETNGALLADLMMLYNKEFEMANTFGYRAAEKR